jgi:YebC/PmpR family DNA-binding regulatory protein
MAGHSQFKNIMHRKGAQDAKRGKIFAKLAREITVAAKSGIPDPKQNPRLRNAIINARHENMPNDKINKALQKGSLTEEENNYEEINYEGVGNKGISLIIETLTDNRNRTASEIRSLLNKNGGTLGETGSASFNFEKIGEIKYNLQKFSKEEFFDFSVEKNALDVFEEENHIIATCKAEIFGKFRDNLELRFGEPLKSKLIWKAKNFIEVDEEDKKKILFIVEQLEENDDVQEVYFNINLKPLL